MARVKNVLEKVAKVKVHSLYNLSCNQADELLKGSCGWLDTLNNTFKFGYLQGMKAAVRTNKKTAANKEIEMEREETNNELEGNL